jgi:hypothetical protein
MGVSNNHPLVHCWCGPINFYLRPLNMPSLSIGDLIADNFGRECIVYSKERRPSAKWLAEQEDARVQQAAGPWWKALPLDGGAVIVPDELGIVVRRATVDDVLRLMESQQTEYAANATLVELFNRLCSFKNVPNP